jgi:hypothetical protein
MEGMMRLRLVELLVVWLSGLLADKLRSEDRRC